MSEIALVPKTDEATNNSNGENEHKPAPISPQNTKKLRDAFELVKAKAQEMNNAQLLLRAVNAEGEALQVKLRLAVVDVAAECNAPLKEFELKEEPDGTLHFARRAQTQGG